LNHHLRYFADKYIVFDNQNHGHNKRPCHDILQLRSGLFSP
jgi:hypothetical protein